MIEPPTKAQIRERLARTGERLETTTVHMVQWTVPRRTRPRPGQRVRLLGTSGPWSVEGTAVSWARGECTAWWSTADLLEWAKPRRPSRDELETFVQRIREVDANGDLGPCAVALRRALADFDRALDE